MFLDPIIAKGATNSSAPKPSKSPDHKEQQDIQKEDRIICIQCRQTITYQSMRTNVMGSHTHTCVNPHGIVYHIGCFESATGSIPHGNPSTHWSWFAGYSWQIVLCSKCYLHLGWLFYGGQNNFFGLILKRLQEEES